MKVSLNSIRGFNKWYDTAIDIAPHGVDELVKNIGAQLGAIEDTVEFGTKYDGVVVAKIVSCIDHPNADRLHVCMIDDGGVTPNINRNENGHVQVVCGAPNVREGLVVAWLPPGATVPESYTKDPFVLEARELRGIMSTGMLASVRELDLGESHDSILEITDPFDRVHVGDNFGEAFDLQQDTIIDIENKMFTHRPDCFGFMGVSRELAGIQGIQFKSPAWYQPSPTFPAIETDELPLQIHNEIPGLVSRFTAIVLRDVQVGPSPTWLVVELAKVGVRSINNIVDYTNFFMLETGQPLHAYDYDKVKALSGDDGATIYVRNPRESEKIKLLNGKIIDPRQQAIMIATDKQLIGFGGIMGGEETEVDNNTTNIIIESATFDMYSVRRSSMEHGLFTDAVTRFNKGQSPLQNLAVLAKIVDEIRQHADGKVASQVYDDDHLSPGVRERGTLYPAIPVTTGFINLRLGLELSAEQIKTLLENVECKVELLNSRHPELVSGPPEKASETANEMLNHAPSQDETVQNDETIGLSVQAPFWRTDIETREDIVEEVGRLYGFDKLPLALPRRSITPAQHDAQLALKATIRNQLAKAGANEVLTYSFVHGDLLDKVGQDKQSAYQIGNALSPELQFYRLSLTPSLLEKVHSNLKAGYNEFALFELGKAHVRGHENDGLPIEFDRVALVVATDKKAKSAASGAPFYLAKQYLMELLTGLHVLGPTTKLSFQPLDPNDADVAVTYLAPERSATVLLSGHSIGRIGEYKSSVRRALKLPDYVAGFELGLTPLLDAKKTTNYKSLPRFPKIEQDICLKVTVDMVYEQLYDFVSQELTKIQPEQTLLTISPVDIYQRPDDTAHKQITLRLSIASYKKTMTDTEVAKLLDTVVAKAKDQFAAERI